MTFCAPTQKSFARFGPRSRCMHLFELCIYACACRKTKKKKNEWIVMLLYCENRRANENWNSSGFEVSDWVSMQEIFSQIESEREKILFTSLICRIKHTCFVYTKNIRRFTSRTYFRSTQCSAQIYRCFEIVQQMFLFRSEFLSNFVFLIWFSFRVSCLNKI